MSNWSVVKNVKIVDESGKWIASAVKQGWTTPEQAHQHAALIASAPDLLAALRELVAEFDAANADRDPARDGLIPETGGIVLARAAIAKAEGQQ